MKSATMKDALFCDMETDGEKSNFFLCGRGYETGVIAHAIQNDVAMAYHRCNLLREVNAALKSQVKIYHDEIVHLSKSDVELRARIEKLERVCHELADMMQGVIEGDYTPDSLTLQPYRALSALDKENAS